MIIHVLFFIFMNSMVKQKKIKMEWPRHGNSL